MTKRFVLAFKRGLQKIALSLNLITIPNSDSQAAIYINEESNNDLTAVFSDGTSTVLVSGKEITL